MAACHERTGKTNLTIFRSLDFCKSFFEVLSVFRLDSGLDQMFSRTLASTTPPPPHPPASSKSPKSPCRSREVIRSPSCVSVDRPARTYSSQEQQKPHLGFPIPGACLVNISSLSNPATSGDLLVIQYSRKTVNREELLEDGRAHVRGSLCVNGGGYFRRLLRDGAHRGERGAPLPRH